jgi:hypothetical protein
MLTRQRFDGYLAAPGMGGLERHRPLVQLPAARALSTAQAAEVDGPVVAGDDLLVPAEEVAADPVPHGFISLKVESPVTER